MRHGSLFSGIGGFDLAAEWMGWENVFHCEINEFGRKVLNHYWPNATSHEDITTTDFSVYRNRIGVLTGGFPCQPFSTAGERKGEDDPRYLAKEMLRAIREIQPGWVVAENVYGITSRKFKNAFQFICSSLEDYGYKVQPYIIPVSAVEGDHERYRTWFVAYSDEKFGRLPIQSENDALTDERKQQKKEWSAYWKKSQLASYSIESFKKWANRPIAVEFYDGISPGLDAASFFKESGNAFGNAVVPQMAYEIFKTIEQTSQLSMFKNDQPPHY